MDPQNKPKGPSPHYSLYQREVFKRGGSTGQLPTFSVHPDGLQDSVKNKLNDRGYFYANSNAGVGWTDRANREAFYRWRIIPRTLVDTNTRDLTTTLFGHRIPAPILFAPIGINKLYTSLGELVPAKIAGELGIPVRRLHNTARISLIFLRTVLPVHSGLTAHRGCRPCQR
ncbi:FMN-dependent dehydrogenase-domain-containing protein [Amylocystis lapponica]|nr:FMN-dependent dehydrogenase-domain-containing protein [Amylocystis lapponica]